MLRALTDLFVERGPPGHIPSHNRPEFVTKSVGSCLGRVGVKTLFIELGSPWENGYNENSNGQRLDELPEWETFHSMRKADVLIALATALQHGQVA